MYYFVMLFLEFKISITQAKEMLRKILLVTNDGTFCIYCVCQPLNGINGGLSA